MNKEAILARATTANVAVFTGVVSAVAGAVSGYFFAKKKLNQYVENAIVEMERDLEDEYRTLRQQHKIGEYASPESTQLAIFREAAVKLGYTEATQDDEAVHAAQPVSPMAGHPDYEMTKQVHADIRVDPAGATQYHKPVATNHNIWQNQALKIDDPVSEADWTWDKEMEFRARLQRDKQPYLISAHELFTNENEYEQKQLFYYLGDQVLIDIEGEKELEDGIKVIGKHNLSRFGEFSNNPELVHVRNDEIGVDFEIWSQNASYGRDVVGFRDDEEDEPVADTSARSRF